MGERKGLYKTAAVTQLRAFRRYDKHLYYYSAEEKTTLASSRGTVTQPDRPLDGGSPPWLRVGFRRKNETAKRNRPDYDSVRRRGGVV